MALYTVVTEGSDLAVYRSLKALCAFVVENDLCLEADGDKDPVPATAKQVARALKAKKVQRLWPKDGGDWTHRIEAH